MICKNDIGISDFDQVVEKPEEDFKMLLNLLKEQIDLKNLILNIHKIISYSKILFEPELDKICFIVDRDKDSFTERQYDYVQTKCYENRYGLYVTNPNFEFWLLLHFEDVCALEYQKLIDNIPVTAHRRYTENELRNRMPRFSKSSYDAGFLVNKIDIAIKNEKKYCEDISELKNKVGSNIGILIEEMRQS